MKTLLIAALLALLAGTASADEIYTYTGPAPADLSGSFTTPEILAPDGTQGFSNALLTNVLAWSFTDGVDTWTPANSTFGGTAWINADGSFAVWAFDIFQGQNRVAYSQTLYSAFYYQDMSPLGDSWVANQASWDKPKGSWTMTDPISKVAEPGTFALLGAGLALISLISLRVKA
jgi:hypothetical protein